MAMSLRDTIAEFVVHEHKVSDELEKTIRGFFADYLAVTEGGSHLQSSFAAHQSIRTVDQPTQECPSPVFGTSLWARADDAALANGISGHGLELDDTHEASSSHPGVVVISAVTALAAELDSRWDDVLTAIVVGYDVMGGVGVFVGARETYARGFHPTAVSGAIGAAAACATLRGLGTEQTAESISLASNLAAGSLEFLTDGSWTKRLNAGHAASIGLRSTAMGEAGFKGPVTAIEGPHGFAHQHGLGVVPGRSLDLEFGTVARQTSIKFFPCCRYMHGGMDLLAQYRLENPHLDLESVKEIDVAIITAGRTLVSDPPKRKLSISSSVDAQFSMPFGAAACLTWGRIGPEVFEKAAHHAPELLPLMRKVVCTTADDIDEVYPQRWASRVTITFSDGRREMKEEPAFLGSPGNPANAQQLSEKHNSLVGAVRAEQLQTAISALADSVSFRSWSEKLGH